MHDIIGRVLFIAVFFGLEIVAVVLLVLSALFARQRVVVIVCVVVSAVLMAVESLMWYVCVMAGYEFGFRSDTTLIIVSAVSILSLCVYFPIALRRCKPRQGSCGGDNYASGTEVTGSPAPINGNTK